MLIYNAHVCVCDKVTDKVKVTTPKCSALVKSLCKKGAVYQCNMSHPITQDLMKQ